MGRSYRSVPGYISLRDAMNDLFEGSMVSQRPGNVAGPQSWTPAVDAHETENYYVVNMALPGVEPDKINISGQGSTVVVTGEIERLWQRDQGRVHLQEIETGRFSRTFDLGGEVDLEKADASFYNGILTLTLPKAALMRTRQIKVKTAQPSQGTSASGSQSSAGKTSKSSS